MGQPRALWLALIAILATSGLGARAADLVPEGDCAVIVASRASLPEVRAYVDQELKGRPFEIYLSSNGWYAISIGLIEEERAQDFINSEQRGGNIPKDSFCSSGSKFKQLVSLPESKFPPAPASSQPGQVDSKSAGAESREPLEDFELFLTAFDARLLTPAETRVLQLALASEGHYRGLLDGKWGPASQKALNGWVAAENPDLANPRPLFADTFVLAFIALELFDETGWHEERLDDTPFTLGAPWDRLERTSEDPLTFMMDDKALYVFYNSGNDATTRLLHQTTLDEMRDGEDPYLLRRNAKWVTKLQETSGWLTYLRSDKISGVWHSIAVAAKPKSEHWLNLVASGIRVGNPRDWQFPEDGVLYQVILQGAALAAAKEKEQSGSKADKSKSPEPETPATATPETATPVLAGSPASTGTGFYINNTDIVTAEHVISDCARITTRDGTSLTLIDTDAGLDIAALTSPQRSKVWLAMSESVVPNLGQKVFAIGYPYYGLVGTGLHLTSGNISSLSGPGDDTRFLAISAPVQPGNSGGPILSAEGEILGVVSARLSQSFISENTGSLPQNLNYATSLQELRGFLEQANIFFPRGEVAGFRIDEGAPERVQRAVIPIFCWR